MRRRAAEPGASLTAAAESSAADKPVGVCVMLPVKMMHIVGCPPRHVDCMSFSHWHPACSIWHWLPPRR